MKGNIKGDSDDRYEKHMHQIEPIFDDYSRILIMGTFPSVKSRQIQFFYGHPQNRFWKVVSMLLQENLPVTIEQKREMLLRNHVALWDVIAQCEIIGSSDSSIKNVVPNDINKIIDASKVQTLFTNGKKAKALYDRYLLPVTGKEAICLPSTSPANASYSLEKLAENWKTILQYL